MTSPVEAAFGRRVDPGLALADAAGEVARACRDMAVRFGRGGQLITFGDGAAAADAAHLAVEFVHPVLVGKRALPAVSLANDGAAVTGLAHAQGYGQVYAAQLRLLGRPDDIAVAIAAGAPGDGLRSGLAAARELGMLTVALTAGVPDGVPVVADHVLNARTGDPRIAKEIHVTTYHILWELVHVFLDQPAPAATEVPR